MKFYFPDSQDQVSPTYDFIHDEHSPLRVRQRDDRYAHEVLAMRPYDGILYRRPSSTVLSRELANTQCRSASGCIDSAFGGSSACRLR